MSLVKRTVDTDIRADMHVSCEFNTFR